MYFFSRLNPKMSDSTVSPSIVKRGEKLSSLSEAET